MEIHTPNRIIELDDEEKNVLIAALFAFHGTLVRISDEDSIISEPERIRLASEAATAIWLAEELSGE